MVHGSVVCCWFYKLLSLELNRTLDGNIPQSSECGYYELYEKKLNVFKLDSVTFF